jgi:SAM-dependent methyltransferase
MTEAKFMIEASGVSLPKQTKAYLLRLRAVQLLRKLGLLPVADELRLWLTIMKNWNGDKAFATLFPTEAFPPTRMAAGTVGRSGYEGYYEDGERSVKVLLQLIAAHVELNGARILEWGCGPARLVRHLARLAEDSRMEVFATDYDRATIEWCKSAIPGVTFARNGLQPPLPFPDGFFDVVYSSSVFTHLSEALHYAWLKENFRVVKPAGLVIFTTAGDSQKHKLLPAEIPLYEAGELVVRTAPLEGAPRYNAFHSPAFVRRKLLPSVQDADLIRHETELHLAGVQDTWVVRKRQRTAGLENTVGFENAQ